MRNLTGLIVIFLVAVSTSVSGQQTENSGPEELADLPERWTSAMNDLRTPGMAVVIVRGDEVIYRQCFGHRDVEKKLPVTANTTFYVASCTKTYLATIVTMLCEEGRIQLDAPVSKYLPEFRLADQNGDAITVKDLLTHAKGINSGPIVFLDAYSGQITEQRYYQWLQQVEPTGQPQYTNVHFTLLGRVVESVTGQSWKDVLQERILDPLAMDNSTAYASKMYTSDDVAIPAICTAGELINATTRKSDRTMHAAGGMGASVDDLATWLIVQLNGGKANGKQVVSAKSIAEMHRLHVEGDGGAPRIPGMEMNGFGLSWFVTKYKGHALLQHTGGYVGCSAIIAFMPEEQLGVAVVSNSMGILPQLATFDIFDRLLDLEQTDLLPRVTQMTNQFYERIDKQADELGDNPANGGLSLDTAAYVGKYENEMWGTAEIEQVGGNLLLRFGDQVNQLGSNGEDQFAAMAEMSQPASGRFETSGGKVTSLVFKFSNYPDEVAFERK